MVVAQQVVGPVVDVDQHRVVARVGATPQPLEAVALDDATARVARQRRGHRHEAAPVPRDDLRQELDDVERVDLWERERGGGGVPEAEPADEDTPVIAIELAKGSFGQCFLDEKTGKRRFIAVLGIPPISSAVDAVRASIAGDETWE